MFLTVHRPPQHGLICLLLALVGCPVLGAPFEIKVHDELIAEYQESAYEIETNLFQAPASQGLKTNVFHRISKKLNFALWLRAWINYMRNIFPTFIHLNQNHIALADIFSHKSSNIDVMSNQNNGQFRLFI